jgi:hypothetical protein
VVLVKCWTGCSFREIVAATGLKEEDLFPPRPKDFVHFGGRPLRKPFPAADVLRAVAFEALVVYAIANSAIKGTLDETGRRRAALAASRLRAAVAQSGYGND